MQVLVAAPQNIEECKFWCRWTLTPAADALVSGFSLQSAVAVIRELGIGTQRLLQPSIVLSTIGMFVVPRASVDVTLQAMSNVLQR